MGQRWLFVLAVLQRLHMCIHYPIEHQILKDGEKSEVYFGKRSFSRSSTDYLFLTGKIITCSKTRQGISS